MGKNRRAGAAGVVLMASLVGASVLLGCSNEEVGWETATSAAGSTVGDQEFLDERFREYRVAVGRALDEMSASLENARRGGSVADRPQVDALTERVASLRRAFVESVGDAGPGVRDRQAQLEASYDALRADVETFLLRTGASPDEIARWRAAGD